MKAEVKEAWVAALRSGEYEQGQNYLRDHNDNYCCLGVLTDLAVKAGVMTWDGLELATATVPEPAAAWAGLADRWSVVVPYDGHDRVVANLNDSGTSFDTIAGLIEQSDL